MLSIYFKNFKVLGDNNEQHFFEGGSFVVFWSGTNNHTNPFSNGWTLLISTPMKTIVEKFNVSQIY
jgi:hypothetical protein